MPATKSKFLSTPSARRATQRRRAARRARQISIHALREEGDSVAALPMPRLAIFLSTPSARRATDHPGLLSRGVDISIHALREEGDYQALEPREKVGNFYPRPPRGGRQSRPHTRTGNEEFLSTPSARRATVCVRPRDENQLISIHALREEGDSKNRDKISIFL